MPKVLAQVGVSLADVYQVLGSIAGVEQLISHDVNLVHEMGATIFSERLSAVVERATTGAIAQSTTFDVDVATGGVGISRVLGVLVFADVIGRADFCQVSSRGTGSGREIPFYHWDQVSGTEEDIRLVDNGAAAANVINLVPAVAPPPSPEPTRRTGPAVLYWRRNGDARADHGVRGRHGGNHLPRIHGVQRSPTAQLAGPTRSQLVARAVAGDHHRHR